jgi:hypothetical protein
MSALDHRSSVEAAEELPDGTLVSLRRVRLRDLDALISLAARGGILCEQFELARLVRSDPAERLVMCATTLVDATETVVGIGVIELGSSATMPSLILVDPAHGRSLARWLAESLVARARAAA